MDNKQEIQKAIESKDVEKCSRYIGEYYELCRLKEVEINTLKTERDNLDFKIKNIINSTSTKNEVVKELLNKNIELEIKNKELSKIIKYMYDLPLKNKIFSFIPRISFISKSYFNWIIEYNSRLDSRVDYVFNRVKTFEASVKSNNSFYNAVKNKRVASISEEYLHTQLEATCNHKALTITNYTEELINFSPEFFICESVKIGPIDENKNSWKGKIYHSDTFNYENREDLLKILEICKQRNITSIFIYNRDANMIDNMHINFMKTAQMFDYIFVTTSEAFEKLNNLGYRCYYFNKIDKKVEPYIIKKEYDYVVQKKKPKNLGDFKCVTILDEFSYNAFSSVFNLTPLMPENAIETICKVKPDFFLCESAWQGFSGDESGAWKAKVYSSDKFNYENRLELIKIINFCNANNIPTIFWNKEDPTHFDDMHTNFVDTAGMFDTILTTAVECVEKYKNRFQGNIGYLPFGTPIFTPQKGTKDNEKVTFFGGWYNIHETRCKDMEMIFDLLIEKGFPLEIFDRFSEENNSEKTFPEKYKPYIKKSISQVELWEKYGNLKYGINISTVTDSETMVARRVFELALSEVLIISNEAKALSNIFGENVIILPRDIEKLHKLTKSEYDEMISNCKEIVLKKFLQGQIALDMLSIANIPVVKNVRYVKEISNVDDFREEKFRTLYIFENSVDSNQFADIFSKFNSEKTNIVLEKYCSLSRNELYYTGNVNDDVDEFIDMALSGVKVHTRSGQLFVGGKNEYIDYYTNI